MCIKSKKRKVKGEKHSSKLKSLVAGLEEKRTDSSASPQNDNICHPDEILEASLKLRGMSRRRVKDLNKKVKREK